MYTVADKKPGNTWPSPASWTPTPTPTRSSSRTDLTWSDGTPVTSKDLVGTAICAGRRSMDWNFLATSRPPDDQTVVFTICNPDDRARALHPEDTRCPDTVYGSGRPRPRHCARPRPVSTAPRAQKLNTRLPEVPPRGPGGLADRSTATREHHQAQLTLIKNDKGYNADNLAFDKVVLYNGETPDVTPLVMAKDVDYATHGFPVASEQTFTQPTASGSSSRRCIRARAGLQLRATPRVQRCAGRQAIAYC